MASGLNGRRLAVFMALFLAGCAETPAQDVQTQSLTRPATAPLQPPPIGQQIVALKTRLFMLVEEQRLRLAAGAKPLALDQELDGAAQAHADAMAIAKTFDPDSGSNRAIETLLDDPRFYGFVGENVAAQFYTASVGMDPDKYAQGFLDIWLGSEQHKSNITFPAFGKTGIGIAVTGDEVFVAQLFATEMAPTKPQP